MSLLVFAFAVGVRGTVACTGTIDGLAIVLFNGAPLAILRVGSGLVGLVVLS